MTIYHTHKSFVWSDKHENINKIKSFNERQCYTCPNTVEKIHKIEYIFDFLIVLNSYNFDFKIKLF